MVTDRAPIHYPATGTGSTTPRVAADGSVRHLTGWGWVWTDVRPTREEAQRAAEAWLRRRAT